MKEYFSKKALKKTTFTLIELLIVVAIIIILMTLIQPALKQTINNAKKAVCVNNLRNWHAMITLYLDDNHGRYPRGGNRKMVWIKYKSFLKLEDYGLKPEFGCTSYEDDPIADIWGIPSGDGDDPSTKTGVIYWANREIDAAQLNKNTYRYAKKESEIDQATSQTLATCFARKAFNSGLKTVMNHIPHLDGESINILDEAFFPPDPEGLAVTQFDGSTQFVPFKDLQIRTEAEVASFWYLSIKENQSHY